MGGSQSTTNKQNIQEKISNILNTNVSNNFSTKMTSKTTSVCSAMVNQDIKTGDINLTGFGGTTTIENKAVIDVKCVLENTSNVDMRDNIAESLTAAFENVLSNEGKAKLNQQAKTGFMGASFDKQSTTNEVNVNNSVSTEVNNYIKNSVQKEITDEVLNESKGLIVQTITTGNINNMAYFKDLNIKNDASVIVKSEVVNRKINNIINEMIQKADIGASNDVKTNFQADVSQVRVIAGLDDFVKSIFGGIFGAFWWVAYIIFGLVLLYILMKMFGGGGSGGSRSYNRDYDDE